MYCCGRRLLTQLAVRVDLFLALNKNAGAKFDNDLISPSLIE